MPTKTSSSDESSDERSGESSKDSKKPKKRKVKHALTQIADVLGTARGPTGKRTGVALRLKARPKDLYILDIALTLKQNRTGFTEWVLNNELDQLLELGIETLGAALREAAKDKDVAVLDFPGHHKIIVEGASLSAYAWSGNVYFLGSRPPFKVYATGAAAVPVLSQGDWKAWVEAIEPIAKKNPRLLASLCVAFSAALLRALGMPSFTWALWAPTSKGKSTIQLVCSSTTGWPKSVQWKGTEIGIQDTFGDHPDQPLCVHDMHGADKSEDIASLIMAAGDGTGRLISKRSSASNAPREIHSLPIASTEKSLSSMAGKKAASGMFARYFEIGLGKYGMFDDLCGFEGGAALSKHLKEVVSTQCGTIWPRWLKLLSKSWPKVLALHAERLAGLRQGILKAAKDPELDDITNRVLDNLVFAAFAGLVATKLDLWDVSTRRITSAFGLLLREHLDRTPSGNALVARNVEAIAGYIETHGDKFPALSEANDPERSGHSGFLIEDDKHGPLYLFIPAVFRTLFVTKFGEEVYEVLRSAGYLVCHDSRHNRFTKRVPAGPDGKKKAMDFVAIKAGIRYAPPSK